jgi:hypothetical protein
MKSRVVMSAAATLAMAAGMVLVQAAPASAVSMAGCAYPRVCFYLTYGDYWNNRPTAAYQDVTSSWQTLGSRSRGADYIVNTRNDDVAYLHYTNGAVMCLEPNSIAYETYRVVDRVRISSSATC